MVQSFRGIAFNCMANERTAYRNSGCSLCLPITVANLIAKKAPTTPSPMVPG
jgi:hypothetical protein